MNGRLEDIQDDIIARLHAGDPVDRDVLLLEHPEHAEPLRGFFQLIDVIEAPPSEGGMQPANLGEFTVVREIGRGGMGVVYEATQASLKRRVALKVLPAALARSERVVERFRREAEAAGRLRHPGIVPVFSVGEAAGTSFFAMELVDGRSLADVLALRRGGDDAGLPAAGDAWRTWAVETTARIADALAYAHEQGILHRDIKPGNVLLDDKGAPRLTDFGLALDLHADGLTMTGENLGTPQYMSPEQLVRRARGIDARTDIYSLAVTLYELLTLQLPYEAESTAQLFAALQAGQVVPPRKVDADIEPDLEQVLLRALRVDPQDRYADAATFAADLRAVLDHEPLAPTPRRARSRRPRRLAAVGVAALLLIGGVFFALRDRNTPATNTSATGVPAVPTAADWVRLADGEIEDAEETLLGWLEVDVPMRSLQRRTIPDTGPLPEVTPALAAQTESSVAPEAVVLIVRWDRRRTGGIWREIGTSWQYVTSARSATRFTWKLGKARVAFTQQELAQDELGLEHRGRMRLLRRPSGWGKGDRAADFWADLSGVQATAFHSQTLTLVDELPADYPVVVEDAEIDAEVTTLLESAALWIDASHLAKRLPATPVVTLRFGRLERMPPVPIVGQAEVWSADGARRAPVDLRRRDTPRGVGTDARAGRGRGPVRGARCGDPAPPLHGDPGRRTHAASDRTVLERGPRPRRARPYGALIAAHARERPPTLARRYRSLPRTAEAIVFFWISFVPS